MVVHVWDKTSPPVNENQHFILEPLNISLKYHVLQCTTLEPSLLIVSNAYFSYHGYWQIVNISGSELSHILQLLTCISVPDTSQKCCHPKQDAAYFSNNLLHHFFVKTLSLTLALTLACLNPKTPNPNFINPNLPNRNSAWQALKPGVFLSMLWIFMRWL